MKKYLFIFILLAWGRVASAVHLGQWELNVSLDEFVDREEVSKSPTRFRIRFTVKSEERDFLVSNARVERRRKNGKFFSPRTSGAVQRNFNQFVQDSLDAWIIAEGPDLLEPARFSEDADTFFQHEYYVRAGNYVSPLKFRSLQFLSNWFGFVLEDILPTFDRDDLHRSAEYPLESIIPRVALALRNGLDPHRPDGSPWADRTPFGILVSNRMYVSSSRARDYQVRYVDRYRVPRYFLGGSESSDKIIVCGLWVALAGGLATGVYEGTGFLTSIFHH